MQQDISQISTSLLRAEIKRRELSEHNKQRKETLKRIVDRYNVAKRCEEAFRDESICLYRPEGLPLKLNVEIYVENNSVSVNESVVVEPLDYKNASVVNSLFDSSERYSFNSVTKIEDIPKVKKAIEIKNRKIERFTALISRLEEKFNVEEDDLLDAAGISH